MAAEARARMLRIALLVFALELGLGLLLFNLYQTFFLSPDGLAQLDIIAYYAGGVSALEGATAEAYDYPSFSVLQEVLTGAPVEGFPWLYPPAFFLFVAPLGLLSLTAAFLVWGGLNLLSGVALGLIFGLRRWAVAIALLPVLVSSAVIGQNGGLSALVLGGGIALLERRPFVAGLVFSALFYKPHLAVLLPVALLVSGRWRVIGGALLGGSLFFLASIALFGWESWLAFFTAREWIWQGLVEGKAPWERMVTVFAMGRSWGLDVDSALLLQSGLGLLAVALVALVWRRGGTPFALSASLAAAALLTSPYGFYYDAALFAVPLVALLGQGGGLRDLPGRSLALVSAIWILPPLLWGLQSNLGLLLWPLFFLSLLLTLGLRPKALAG
ncbi:glycosyltransferase family 87 protein [Limibacillus halophilus]